MRVGVAYSDGPQQVWLRIDVDDGATVKDALDKSGILRMYPHIDLENQKVGIFGKVAKLDTPIREGDRVEVYRQITCDPTQVPRRDTGDEDED